MRSGSDSVSARDAPDCSYSGAEIQTSSLSWRAIRSSAPNPSAWMPSSLLRRMRIRLPFPLRGGDGGGDAGSLSVVRTPTGNAAGSEVTPPPLTPPRKGEGNGARTPSLVPPNVRQPRQIPVQGLGYGDAAALVLVVLHQRHQGAANGEAGAVQGVDEARPLLTGFPAAGVHPPGLEVSAVRAGADLAVHALARQPDLDVVGLARREAHVAGAQQHGAERDLQPLQHR